MGVRDAAANGRVSFEYARVGKRQGHVIVHCGALGIYCMGSNPRQSDGRGPRGRGSG
jgi:hypothetical protein